MPTVLITGGTGTIGKRLTTLLLQKGYSVNILTRNNIPSNQPNLTHFQWDINAQTIDPLAIQSAQFIIHLAGAGVADKRWSTYRKNEILNSRIKSSALIVKALNEIKNNVQAVISASAIGWYGPDLSSTPPDGFKETDAAYDDFLGNTCAAWEKSVKPVVQLGKRLVILRTGIVLSNKGGALVEFMKPLKFKIAPILGNGKQMISWIHIDDLCDQYIWAIENTDMKGVYNAVAPSPISNKNLVLALALKVVGKYFITFNVPSFILKVILGEMSIEVLKSTTVSCQKILEQGYCFKYPLIQDALQQLLVTD